MLKRIAVLVLASMLFTACSSPGGGGKPDAARPQSSEDAGEPGLTVDAGGTGGDKDAGSDAGAGSNASDAGADGSVEPTVDAGPEDGTDASDGVMDSGANGDPDSSTNTDTDAGPLPSYEVPPDPDGLAPAAPLGTLPGFLDRIAFLYGTGGVQTGMSPGTLVEERVAVLRGRVFDALDDEPLPGVRVVVHEHPEFGQTVTREDGELDLVVNGGGTLIVSYDRPGYLPVQRRIVAPWNDWTTLPDVYLTPLDENVTNITLGSASVQVASGSVITDDDGERQARVLFPAGVTAQMVMPNGDLVPLDTAAVRATEYTVGDNGPDAMPAPLPPESGYTYAVELSVDEALQEGATEVRFSEPVVVHVDNFLGFPAGSTVPVGYYDRKRALWVPMPNGRVVDILSVSGGLAVLDTDGDGLSDSAGTLSALGVTAAERMELAQRFPTGGSVWRAPAEHFSPYDYNWPYRLPDGYGQPPGQDPNRRANDAPKHPCKDPGSTLSCETRALGEGIAIAGTPFSLVYSSTRAPGRLSDNRIRIQVSGDTPPEPVLEMVAEAEIEGRHFSASFAPAAGRYWDIPYDDLDAYGRPVHGSVLVRGRVGYRYLARYTSMPFNDEMAAMIAFGQPWPAGALEAAVRGGVTAYVWTNFEFEVRRDGAAVGAQGIGGFSIDAVQLYDQRRRIVHGGDGVDLDLQANLLTGDSATVAVAVAGDATDGLDPETSSDALAVAVRTRYVAAHPDGGFWLIEGMSSEWFLRRVTPNGLMQRFGCIDDDPVCGELEDGSLIQESELFELRRIAVSPEGVLHFTAANRVWRLEADGRVRLLAGNGQFNDVSLIATAGGPATDYELDLGDIAVGPAGHVYLAHAGGEIFRVTPDGRLEHVTGSVDVSTPYFEAEGQPATESTLGFNHIAVTRAGVVYLASNEIVAEIGRDGIIRHFAGRNEYCTDPPTAGQLRKEACTNAIASLGLGPDDVPYIRDSRMLIRLEDRLRIVASGNPTSAPPHIGSAFDLDLGGNISPTASNSLLSVVDEQIYDIAGRGVGAFMGNNFLVPARGGQFGYVFDPNGRHLETRDILTGGLIYSFEYDAYGLLGAIIDANGYETRIDRDTDGTPIAIVAPGGQRTEVEFNADGYLETVRAPGDREVTLTYADESDGVIAASGLLKTMTLPGGATSYFTWTERGDLESAQNVLGGVTTYARTELIDGYEVTIEEPSGRQRVHRVRTLAGGVVERTSIMPTGAVTTMTRRPEGVTTIVSPDGSTTTLAERPDPRFGMYLPIVSEVTVQKGSRTTTMTTTRAVTGGLGYFGDGALTETTDIDGRAFTTVFDASAGEVRRTTPTGRDQKMSFDENGRVLALDFAEGYAPMTLSYGANGLIDAAEHGDYTYSYEWNDKFLIESSTNAEGHSFAYTFSDDDRPVTITTGGDTVALAWSVDGDVSSYTMPEGGEHAITSDGYGRQTSYTPPGNTNPYERIYRTDGTLEQLVLPSGRTQSYTAASDGRLASIDYPEATLTFGYVGVTGLPQSLTRTPESGTAQTLTYGYSADLATQVDWSGAATGTYAYVYDTSLLLSKVTLSNVGATVEHSVARDDDGLVTAYGPLSFVRGGPSGAPSSIGDGTSVLTLTYAPEGSISGRSLSVSSTPLYAVSLVRDLGNQIIQRIETVDGVSTQWDYAYDPQRRLVQVKRDGVEAEAYTYDANGNRASASYDEQAAELAAYDEQDRIVSFGVTDYIVDEDGFVTARGDDTFVWSATGELLQATVQGDTVTYDYDALRRRVRRTQDTAVTQYLYGDLGDPFRLTASIAPDATLTTYLYDEAGLLVAVERNGSRYFVATDQVGSPRIVTDAAGTILREWRWDSFGRATGGSGSFPLELGYAGGIADAVTGLLHFGFRHYDPLAGRWMARDPIFLGGKQWNLYAYVANNPVGGRDPLGLFCIGGSAYNGIGGGAQVCVGSAGVSACGELGFGFGDGIEVQPLGQPDMNTYIGFEAGAGAKFGPFASAGYEGKYGQYGNPYDGGGHCFKGDSGFKGALLGIEPNLDDLWQTKGDPNNAKDVFDMLRGKGSGDETKFAFEAKAVMKSCGSINPLF